MVVARAMQGSLKSGNIGVVTSRSIDCTNNCLMRPRQIPCNERQGSGKAPDFGKQPCLRDYNGGVSTGPPYTIELRLKRKLAVTLGLAAKSGFSKEVIE